MIIPTRKSGIRMAMELLSNLLEETSERVKPDKVAIPRKYDHPRDPPANPRLTLPNPDRVNRVVTPAKITIVIKIFLTILTG